MRSEADITERLRQFGIRARTRELKLGIGDDCAIYSPRGSREDLIFTTDLFLEGVHFLRETHSAADVARKAVVRSISDIAAMGGAPRFCLSSVAIPAWANTRWVRTFFDTLAARAASYGAVLAGGDLARSATFACDVTVCGGVPRGKALRRDGAKPGDAIYVTGQLGGSALGLSKGKGPAWRRHLHPEPRLDAGNFLREKLRATSAIDISDGLSLDLSRVAKSSGLCADLDSAAIGSTLFPGAFLEQALNGGEDYELAFTVSPKTRVPKQQNGLPMTRIGVMRAGKSGTILLDGRPLAALGYDHFRRRPVL